MDSVTSLSKYLLKLVIPMTNALSCWRLNVEMKKKRTLHSSADSVLMNS